MTRSPAPAPVRLRSFDRSLPMGLLRAREAAMRLFRAHLARHDLTEQRWRVLRALSEDPSTGGPTLDVGEVAERTFLLGPSLSRALLSLTDAGRDLVATVAPESESIYATIEERFGADRLAHLLSDLHELEDALADVAPTPVTPTNGRTP